VDDVTRWIDADWDIGAQHRTFQLKPGVMIGDIGKKMGRDGIDNGYIQVSRLDVERVSSYQKYIGSILGIIDVSDLTVHARKDPPGTHVDETYSSVEGWGRHRSGESSPHMTDNASWAQY
jgi:hypothetical protein